MTSTHKVRAIGGAAACAALTAGALGASAATPAPPKVPVARSPLTSRNTWATIDICRSKPTGDSLGIRGSMAGDGAHAQRMFMRFRVQYQSASDQLWYFVVGKGDSGFQVIGSAGARSRQGGWTYSFTPPAKGGRFVMRGMVDFEWRLGKRVVYQVSLPTAAGHHDAQGAQPKKFSTDVCVMT